MQLLLLASRVHDVPPDAEHMVGAIPAGRIMRDTELLCTIDGWHRGTFNLAVELSPQLGDALQRMEINTSCNGESIACFRR